MGYNKEYKNAFIYLIETGSLWKPPIDSGDFYVFMDKGIDIESIRNNRNMELGWNIINRLFYMRLNDYGYNPDENIVFTYHEKMEDFNFETILSNKEMYFKDMDLLSKKVYRDIKYELFDTKSPYEVDGNGALIGWAIIFMIYVMPILGLVLLALFAIRIVKRLMKKRNVTY